MAKLGGKQVVKPRLVLASTFDQDWDRLRAGLMDRGYELIERRDGSLHHGGPTKRIIGSKLGDILLRPQLASRRMQLSKPIKDSQNALLPLEDVRWVVQQAVDDVFMERVPEQSGRFGHQLQLPEPFEVFDGAEHQTGELSQTTKDNANKVPGSDNHAIRVTQIADGVEIVGTARSGREQVIYVPIGTLDHLIEALKERAATWKVA